MIFVDANIPMYVAGAAHPLRTDALVLVERLLRSRERLVTDAEVFQEILHRYAAIGRRSQISAVFEYLLRIVDEVFPLELGDTQRAAHILLVQPRLSARDAIHLATMERDGVQRILSFDEDFDAWPGISRIGQIV